jgi:hypothetical protein
MYNEGEADEARRLELDSVEEARYTALIQSARYLQGIWRHHDRNVRERSFSVGDLVLRRIQDEPGLHKLNSRWEGPFVVKQVTRPGSYRLLFPDGREVPNSWCRVQTRIQPNRLLVAHDAGAMATVISFRVPPRLSMVARDSSRTFSNTVDPFDWPTPSTLERLAYRATSTTV